MLRIPALSRGRALMLAAGLAVAAVASGCGAIPFEQRPASGYEYASGATLRVAVIDQSGAEWSGALQRGLDAYQDGTAGRVQFQRYIEGAHIVVTVKEYTDGAPPDLQGYNFPMGAGGFATIYDAQGKACNYPPSPLPLNCSGEITNSEIWLNDAIPPGHDLEGRRYRLIVHEVGHALGLTRHSPDLDVASLAQRYGW